MAENKTIARPGKRGPGRPPKQEAKSQAGDSIQVPEATARTLLELDGRASAAIRRSVQFQDDIRAALEVPAGWTPQGDGKGGLVFAAPPAKPKGDQ